MKIKTSFKKYFNGCGFVCCCNMAGFDLAESEIIGLRFFIKQNEVQNENRKQKRKSNPKFF